MKTRRNRPTRSLPARQTPRVRVFPLVLFAVLSLALSGGPAAAGEAEDYQSIRSLLNAARRDEAREAIERFAFAYPASERLPELRFGIAQLEERLFARLALLRRVVNDHPGTQRAADAAIELITISFLSGDAGACIREATRFYRDYPSDPRVPHAMQIQVRALLARNQLRAARELLVELESGGGGEAAWIVLMKAEIFFLTGNLERSRHYLEEVARLGEGDLARAYRLLGEIAYRQGRIDAARGFFRIVRDAYPRSFDAPRASEMLEGLPASP